MNRLYSAEGRCEGLLQFGLFSVTGGAQWIILHEQGPYSTEEQGCLTTLYSENDKSTNCEHN